MARHDDYQPFRRSPSEIHRRERRKNFILNLLIVIVFSLIVIVGWNLLFGHKDETKETTGEPETEEILDEGKDSETESAGKEEANKDKEDDISSTRTSEEETAGEDQSMPEEESAEERDGEEIVIEESDDPNVIKTVINPAWQPVGTVQTGEHVTQYDKNSVDWQEMVRAISYATGLPEEEMIIWFIGRGEVPNKDAIGTVSTRDQSKTYRVYIEWVDGQGWKPVKMEYLRENDKAN